MNTENQRPEDLATSAEAVVTGTDNQETPASVPADPNPEAAAGEVPRRKVQLNPLQPGQVLPIPSINEGRPVTPAPTAAVDVAAISASEIDAEIARAVGASNAPASEVAKSQAQAPVLSSPIDVPAVEDLDSSMQAMLDAALAGTPAPDSPLPAVVPQSLEELLPGTRMQGVVLEANADNVLLDLQQRLTACVPSRQFNQKLPEVGASIEIVVDKVDDNEGLIFCSIPRGVSRVQGDWDALQVDQVVECMVTKTNKGGLDVTVGSLRGFLPASQVDLGFIADLEPFVNQKLRVVVTEVKPKRRRLVVSRRQLLLEERESSRQELMANLKVDDVINGRVKTIKDYGAFIDLGGADGFLPIAQMSWSRIGHPSEILKEGDEVEVKILSIEAEKQRISLGMRQLAANPWKVAEAKYAKGTNVTGRVTRVEAFGAFIELEPGIEGLIHISELEHRRVKRVTEIVNQGDTIEVQVLEVDPGKKRISLSLKALKAKPEPVAPPKDEDLAPGQGQSYQRKRKGDLKGGTGTQKGGLFGDPNKYK